MTAGLLQVVEAPVMAPTGAQKACFCLCLFTSKQKQNNRNRNRKCTKRLTCDALLSVTAWSKNGKNTTMMMTMMTMMLSLLVCCSL